MELYSDTFIFMIAKYWNSITYGKFAVESS